MKKTRFLVLLFIFLLVSSGYGIKKITSKNNVINDTNKSIEINAAISVKYKDGVYYSKNINIQQGYDEAVVTIKNGKIKDIKLKRLDINQKEVNYNDWDGTKNGKPNLQQDRLDLAKTMIIKQSPDVDVIAGATKSSKGWREAVFDALAKAEYNTRL